MEKVSKLVLFYDDTYINNQIIDDIFIKLEKLNKGIIYKDNSM